ncbi:MAG: gamma-glutamyltransferase [Dehalococcoidia bacterium]
MTAQSPHGVGFEAHRPVIMARNGMVSSGHPLASQAGIALLQKGGNAIDAAIAVAAALNVVEPQMSGIGGDGYIMVYRRETGKIDVVNGTGAAPYAATRERFVDTGIPWDGILSISVPGLLDAWLSAHERHGALKLGQVLEPAIDLAQAGFPISQHLARDIAANRLLCQFPASQAIFAPRGRPLSAGEILYQRGLARTFERIVEEGRELFYRGEIARALVQFSQEQGGLLSPKDLSDYRCLWQEPISIPYHGYRVYEAPPNSSGHVLLQELGMAEALDLKALGCNTAESIHAMVEVKKLAFADREAYLADPDFAQVPVQGLLSDEYARGRAALIDPHRASEEVRPGQPQAYQKGARESSRSGGYRVEENTTCFVVVDRWGNAVCQLQSLQSLFGSALVAGETGVLLNNRMTYWHLDPDHVNCLQPGKRVRHTMNPVMVFRERSPGEAELVLVCGTPGADTQVQTNLQVITHVLDFGMTVAEAVEAPRWRHLQDQTESTEPRAMEDRLQLEGRFPQEVRDGLRELGHTLDILDDWGATGSEVMIQRDPATGTLFGAADPRRDGYAIGW